MDLLDFEAGPLYFDEPPPAAVGALIDEASARYGEPEAELLLLRAYYTAPQDYSVLVAVYRYYFYQHRLEDARIAAARVLSLTATHSGLPDDWQALDENSVAAALQRSAVLTRFHLATLKADAYLLMRLGELDAAIARLQILVGVDEADRLGAAALLAVARKRQQEDNPTPKPRLTLVSN